MRVTYTFISENQQDCYIIVSIPVYIFVACTFSTKKRVARTYIYFKESSNLLHNSSVMTQTESKFNVSLVLNTLLYVLI